MGRLDVGGEYSRWIDTTGKMLFDFNVFLTMVDCLVPCGWDVRVVNYVISDVLKVNFSFDRKFSDISVELVEGFLHVCFNVSGVDGSNMVSVIVSIDPQDAFPDPSYAN